MFNRFVLVFGPPVDPIPATVLALARATFPAAAMLHPAAASSVFRFQVTDNIWTVRRAADIPAFGSANQDNLIYLDPRPSNDITSFVLTGPGLSAFYEPVDLGTLDEFIADSPALAYSPLHGRLFREVRGPLGGAYPITVSSGAVAEGTSVLNPFILGFERSGSELSSPTLDKLDLLKMLLRGNNLLACEPALVTECRARVTVRRALLSKLRMRGGPLSIFDRLLFGNQFPSDTEDWGAPAIVLDALGGTFVISDVSGPNSTLRWVWPAERSGNEQWLSDHWCPRWGGTPLTSISATLIPAEPDIGEGHFRPVATPQGTLNAANLLLGVLDLPEPAAFVRDIMRHLPEDDDALNCHFGLVRRDGSRFELDVLALVDRFVRLHLLPRSGCALCFPSNSEVVRQPKNRPTPDLSRRLTDVWAGRALAPKSAPRLAGWAFLERYLRALQEQLSGDLCEIPLRFGWWVDWYDRLFDTPAGVRFVAVAKALVLNEDRLNEARLSPTEAEYDPNHSAYL